jgi:phenylacetate-coenzyme A ligase PaaK-like adenylate-forming protein
MARPAYHGGTSSATPRARCSRAQIGSPRVEADAPFAIVPAVSDGYRPLSSREAFDELTRLYRKSADELESDQLRRVRQAVAWGRRAPFNASRFEGLAPEFSFEDFAKVPELKRDQIKDHLAELVNPDTPEEPMLDSTGGSTGSPTPFYRTKGHWAFTSAVDHTSAAWVGGGWGKRCVVLWGAPMDIPDVRSRWEAVRWTLRGGDWVINCYRTNDEHYDRIRRIIERFRPHVLRGYRSVLLEFCEYLRRTRPLKRPPGVVLSASERLLPEHRSIIEGTLGTLVFDRYGSREMGLAAHECRHKRMHLISPNVRVEIVSEQGVNVPGVPGRIVATSLQNPAMPLIRYDIGDNAIFHGVGCPCGMQLPVMELTLGRGAQMVKLVGNKSIYLIFFHQHLRDFNEIRQWQLVRHAPDHLELRLDLPADAPRIAQVQRTFSEYLGSDVKFVVTSGGLERNRTGKVELFLDRHPESSK